MGLSRLLLRVAAVVVAFGVLGSAPPAAAASASVSTDPATLTSVETYLRRQVAARGLPGAELAVVSGRSTLLLTAVGQYGWQVAAAMVLLLLGAAVWSVRLLRRLRRLQPMLRLRLGLVLAGMLVVDLVVLWFVLSYVPARFETTPTAQPRRRCPARGRGAAEWRLGCGPDRRRGRTPPPAQPPGRDLTRVRPRWTTPARVRS